MADTTAAVPAPSPIIDLLKAYAPSLGQCLVLLTGLVVGVGTTLWVNKPKLSLPVAMADQPRPSTIVSVSDVDHIVAERCNSIGGKLDDILTRLPAAPKKAGVR